MGRHFTKDEIQSMPTQDLVAIVAGTVPTGEYAAEVVWAKDALTRREPIEEERDDGDFYAPA